jgi:hypothetical protein
MPAWVRVSATSRDLDKPDNSLIVRACWARRSKPIGPFGTRTSIIAFGIANSEDAQ